MSEPKPAQPVRKAFDSVSPAGLGIAKNGKLLFPLKSGVVQAHLPLARTFNIFGQPHARVGDFCADGAGTLSAGTVGRVSETGKLDEHPTITIEFLDGHQKTQWAPYVGILTEDQAKEVRDYYVVREKRPERIKRDFWK